MRLLTWAVALPALTVVVSSVTPPVTSTTVMSGLSLVPVMVTLTVVVAASASCPVRSGELSWTLTV